MEIEKLPQMVRFTQAEIDALKELMPVASDYSLHGDESATIALGWMQQMLDEATGEVERLKAMQKRLPYPDDGLGEQKKRFEDTFSADDMLRIEREKRAAALSELAQIDADMI